MSYHGHRGVTRHDGSTPDSWRPFTCGNCNRDVSGAVVATSSSGIEWLQCPACSEGSVRLSSGTIFPATLAGPEIEGLPEDVAAAYNEARRAIGVGALTAGELVCRKILLHVAVDKGAPEGQTFVEYLDHLEAAGYVTPPMRPWVELIRTHGNESTHALPSPTQDRALGTLMFTAELLRLTYEMGHMAARFGAAEVLKQT